MFKKFLAFSSVLFFLFSLSSVQAQFEGKIVFDSYEVSPDGSRKQIDQYNLFITNDRILLDGNKKYNVVGSIQTEGVLVRLDFEDFVFLNGEETALKISKQDITSMMNFFTNGNSENIVDGEQLNYRKTGERKVIKGYSTEEFIFTDRDNSNDYAVVWMTDNLKVDWGMLSEKWGNADLDMLGEDLSFDLVFKEGYFPLLMEAYRAGELRELTEVSHISESSIARAMVQIPSGVKVLSFQDYLFSKMSEQ